MREGIHPDYKATKIQCACGAVIETRSTHGDFHVEICSQCHPFFTGKQKIMDTAGRIERFKTRYSAGQAAASGAIANAEPKPSPAAVAKAAAAKPASKKAPVKDENRAAKRAKANASKPKPKVEAKPAAPEGEAAEAPSTAPASDDGPSA